MAKGCILYKSGIRTVFIILALLSINARISVALANSPVTNCVISAFANPFDSVIAILEREKSAEMKMQLVSAYIANANYTQAKQLVDSLGQLLGFDNYASVQNFIIDMTESGTSFDTIFFDATLKNLVEGIANDTLKLGYLTARVIMRQVFGTYYPEHIEALPLQQQLAKWGGSSNDNKTKNKEEATKDFKIKEIELPEEGGIIALYPNPAKESITIDYDFNATINAEITFYDIIGRSHVLKLKGKNGKERIDLKNWNTGLYYYTIVVNNNTIARDKIVVIK